MPKIETEFVGVKVRAHTFRWIPPSEAIADKVPNACNECHTDKDPKWAITALSKWKEQSPWRVR